MKPYYQDKFVTIYHGDCMDILPKLENVDLVLTDPPYGIGRDGQKPSTGSHGGRKAYEFCGWDQKRPSNEMILKIIEKGKNAIIWGGNYFHLPVHMGWLVWDKGQRIDQSDGELAWTTSDSALRIITINRVELQKDGTNHPTQKPVKLMSWCILQFEHSNSILDPFMGAGTTLRAAKDLKKQAIGIDREEKYCEIAAKRMAQEILEF